MSLREHSTLLEQNLPENAYKESVIIEKLQERKDQGLPLRIAFFDIDATLTGNSKKVIEVRRELEEQGYLLVFVTSRTEEMTMSSTSYELSRRNGWNRPRPQLKRDGDEFLYAPLESLPEFQGLYDPDGIAAQTGNVILMRQKDGSYKEDIEYEKRLRKNSDEWRDTTLSLLREFNQKAVDEHLSAIDFPDNYSNGKVDVAPLPFRINLDFFASETKPQIQTTGATTGGIEASFDAQEHAFLEREQFIHSFEEFRRNYGGVAYRKEVDMLQEQYALTESELHRLRFLRKNLLTLSEASQIRSLDKIHEYEEKLRSLREKHAIDHQKIEQLANIHFIDDSNPENGRYSIYVTPGIGSKERAVNEIIKHVTEEVLVPRSDLHILFAGDSYPDVPMALYGGIGAHATFILSGGSRLTPVMYDPEVSTFAGQNFRVIKRRMEKKGDGIFTFAVPGGFPERTVIIGDVVYPGTKGPETIVRYLKEHIDKK